MAKTIDFAPQGGATGKVCMQVPNLNAADLDFARSTEATIQQQDGVLKTDYGVDLPRYEFKNGDTCPRFLLEPQSTNLFTFSEDLSNSIWGKSNASIGSNSIASPDGNITADKLIESNTDSAHSVSAFVTKDSNFTTSIYAKAGERTHLCIFIDGPGSRAAASYNLTDGTIRETFTLGDFSQSIFKITDYGNGWYRCELTVISSVLASIQAPYFLIDNESVPLSASQPSYQGDGVSGLFLWGAQMENKKQATSYIPTVATTVTRALETCSKTGLSSYLANTGVLFFHGYVYRLVNEEINISDGSLDNRIRLVWSADLTAFHAIVVSGGVAVFTGSYDFTSLYNQEVKIALSYKNNEYKLYINGVKEAEQLSGAFAPTGTLSRFGFDSGTGTTPFFGETKQLSIYNDTLNNSELTTLTTI